MFLQFVVRAAQRAVVVEAERHCSIRAGLCFSQNVWISESTAQ
jgi:hypothetical protein